MARIAAFLLALLAAGLAGAAGPLPVAELAKPGRVLMLRHAYAPGTGDPANFKLGDCATQRNLNDEGRDQARKLGEALRAAGIKEARIWSSQWCRCLETARLLNLGPVQELPALNSFFGRPDEKEKRLDSLRQFLARQPSEGPPIVLVTHQVLVTAHTERWVESAAGEMFQREGADRLRHLGAMAR